MPENPAEPLPRWGILNRTTATLEDHFLGGRVVHEVSVTSPGTGAVSLGYSVLLAMPQDARRVLINCVVEHTYTTSSAAHTSDGAVYQIDQNAASPASVNDLAFSSAAANTTFTDSYTVEWTRGGGQTDWLGSREAFEASPPTTDGLYCRWEMTVSASALSGRTATSTLRHVAEIVEIELEDTTIYTPPTTPVALAATALSQTEIDLAWEDYGGDEDGIRIERSLTGVGAWTEIATVAQGVTTYSDTGLSASTQYFYRVRSYSSATYSNVASATTLGLDSYLVGDGHNRPLNELTALTPQPSSAGVRVTRRSHAPEPLVDEFKYIEFVYSALGSVTEFQAVLNQWGVLSSMQNEVTFTAKDETLAWTRFNGTAVRPQMGSDVQWSRYFPRDVVVLVKELTEVA
jgi:hypothetical protein